MINNLQLIPLLNIPLIQPGDDLAGLIFEATQRTNLELTHTDILVIAQKIVSKAEDCFVRLADVTPSQQAVALAEITGKPPELVEVILWDTAEVIRAQPGLLIVEHKL
ncbi:MAG: coenzyme F420-0:L-glutamate ligase, partial [Anaerolineae bacterium]|nr:coenzyme F420-0:L-glutamate ligase [Anaerolineae bacterium]